MTAVALAVLGASLLGSVHCAGMCGGLVALYTGTSRSTSRRAWAAHAAYNGGRLVAYATLGALGGLAGAALDLGGALAGVQRVAALVAGALIAVWGLATLLEGRGVRVPALAVPAPLRDVAGRALGSVTRMSGPARGLTVGLVTGLLPCGWLWAFVVAAAGTGRPDAGAGLMAAFWLGTLPMMVAVGVGLRALSAPFRRHLPAASGLVMLTLGLLAVLGRFLGHHHAGP